MRKIFVLLLSASLFTLTGCFDIVEEVFLNKNGSGKYLITMDMSSMFSDSFMKGMMEEALAEQNGGAAGEMEKDTVIYFKDISEEADLTTAEAKLIENATMKMNMSQKNEKMLVVMEFPFQDVKDLAEIMKIADKVGADENMGGGMMGGGMITSKSALFELNKKTLARLPMPKPNTEEAEEGMEMIKMFLGGATYKTIYHLPGKVKKTNIPGAEVDGNTVTVEASLLEMIDGKSKIDGTIKFK